MQHSHSGRRDQHAVRLTPKHSCSYLKYGVEKSPNVAGSVRVNVNS